MPITRRKKTKNKSSGIKRAKKDQEQKEKTPCPYCGNEYVSLGRHLPYCKQNPKTKKPTPKKSQDSDSDVVILDSVDYRYFRKQLSGVRGSLSKLGSVKELISILKKHKKVLESQ